MKRFLCACALLLSLPMLAAAQAEAGTYILVDNRQVVYQGDLVITGQKLVARAGGKKKVWQASEVYWARIGRRHFLPVGGFQTTPSPYSRVERGLAEILDSGRVSLLRYDYEVQSGGMGGAGMNGVGMGAPTFYTATKSVYLLQVPTEDEAQAIPMNLLSGKGNEFRAMLTPYFSSRPDLLELLEKGVIKRGNLAAFFHAFNTKQPFVEQPGTASAADSSPD